MRWLLILTLSLFPVLAAAGPAEAVAAATRDAGTLGPAAVGTYYLHVHHPKPADKKLAWQVLSAHVNFLSREPDIVSPVVILADGSLRQWPGKPVAETEWGQVLLIRLNVQDYRWSRKIFVNLREQDPFFHTPVIDEHGRKDFFLAPWLAETGADQKALTALIGLTQSAAPILRADNFLWQTAIQVNRVVGYYGLLEVADQKAFEKLVAFDRKASRDFIKELLAILANSGVAIEPRLVGRDEKIGGAFWFTLDNKLALDRNNPIRVLDGTVQADASEFFAHLANGLWALFLANNQGVRQDSAPDFVGGDRFTHNNDFKIHIYLSCIRCHRNGGLQDLRDYARKTFRHPTPLQSPDVKALLDARRKYLRYMESWLSADRLRYANALLECNGMKPEEYADALGKYFAQIDQPVDLARAAEDLNTTPAYFVAMLRKDAIAGTDPVLATFLKPAKEQEPIPLFQWYEALPLAHLALRGLTVWPQKE